MMEGADHHFFSVRLEAIQRIVVQGFAESASGPAWAYVSGLHDLTTFLLSRLSAAAVWLGRSGSAPRNRRWVRRSS